MQKLPILTKQENTYSWFNDGELQNYNKEKKLKKKLLILQIKIVTQYNTVLNMMCGVELTNMGWDYQPDQKLYNYFHVKNITSMPQHTLSPLYQSCLNTTLRESRNTLIKCIQSFHKLFSSHKNVLEFQNEIFFNTGSSKQMTV